MHSCDGVFYLNGQHYISKYKENAMNLVDIHIVVFRYKQFTTDIVFTFNNPVVIK
jgi:hypothetical protein